MIPAIKFCGLTREEDAAYAARLGARFVGAVFAGGPRNLTAERARDVLARAGAGVVRVGVFADADVAAITETARVAALDIIQLHGDPGVSDVTAVRRATRCRVWGVLRLSGADLPERARAMIAAADATLLDSRVEGRLGGTGVALPWSRLAASLAPLRGGRMLILAGGLTPTNVREAIAAFRPDVVDVSSGVERSPGVKDHAMMGAFALAVRS